MPEKRPDDGQTPRPITVIGRDRLTVLRCRNGAAAKTFRGDNLVTGPIKLGTRFDAEPIPVSSLFDLGRAVDALAGDPKAFVIRGEPVDGLTDIVRKCRGKTATFKGAARHWICLDLDGTEQPGFDPADPAGTLRRLLDTLRQMADVSVFWQCSASWGVKPGIRAHLWIWLAEPRTDEQVKAWTTTLPIKVDAALFNPVQPHFVARPRFTDGALDVMALLGVQRSGFILREGPGELYIPSGDAENELDYWCREIEALDGAARHPVVNKAAYSLGGWVGSGLLAVDEVEARLVSAMEDSGAFEETRLAAARGELSRALRDGMAVPRAGGGDWKSKLIRNAEGGIRLIPANYLTVFRDHPLMRGRLSYDVRSGKVVATSPLPWQSEGLTYPRELIDPDDLGASEWLASLGVYTSAVTLLGGCLDAVARSNPRDDVVAWLEGLPIWDGVPRAATWMQDFLGVEGNEYVQKISRAFLVSMVARAKRPGCKVDTCLTLVGPQGALKSTALRVLASGPGEQYFSDCLGDIQHPKDVIPNLQGPWLLEEAELAEFGRRENASIKAFLSTNVDRARLAYGRRAVDLPRRCVIVASTNQEECLTDATGNRRFWVVSVGAIDIEGLRNIREQLFAEAVALFSAGEPWYLDRALEAVAATHQERHTLEDMWVGPIRLYLEDNGQMDYSGGGVIPRMTVTTADIAGKALEIPAERRSRGVSTRIGLILKKLGWVPHIERAGEYRGVRVYERKEGG
jgi:putative DNA primase/helicase